MLLDGKDSAQTPDSVARRLVDDARRSYDGRIDDATLEQCARDAVGYIWHDSIRVTIFVPVLATRRMREILSSRIALPSGAPSS
jgi:hypothetical protein